MTKPTKDRQLFTVARVFFLLIVIPLSLMALLIANGIFKLGVTIKEKAVTVLDQKAQEEIKIRAVNVADEVANFLREREKDVLVATILPATETAYRQFVQDNRKPIWVKEDGKIRQVSSMMYMEMALIDRSGRELLKIVNGDVVPKSQLVNVSIPANTTYKTEEYFAAAKGMAKGEVYISPLTGWYVSRMEFEKGKRFAGVIRLAAPVFDKQGFAGVVALALDYRQLAGFTDHIIPTQSGYVFEADANTGNYAYMVDSRGFVISHPNDYHIAGLYPDGTPVPALSDKNAQEMTKKGEMVLNLRQLAFMDPQLPAIDKDAATGKSGIKMYRFGGHTKFVAYAPIQHYSKAMPAPGGFGWIGMGLDVDKYNEAAIATSRNIEKEAKAWSATIIVILVVSVVILFLILLLLARGITRSLEAEVPEGSEEVKFDEEEDEDDK